jgi:hypothetical protein
MAELGKGATLKDSSDYAIARIKTIGAFGVTKADIETTTHDVSGNFRSYMAGLGDGGEIPVTCDLLTSDSSGQIAAIADCLAGTEDTYTITLPNTDASTFVFRGYVKSYKIDPRINDTIGLDLVFKTTGSTAYPGPVFTV